MANVNSTSSTLPFYERIPVKHTFSRVMDSSILLLLLLLLASRVFSINDNNYSTFPCFVAFLCESWFTFAWILIISTKWTPVKTITYLDRLRVPELPAVDLFVTTADPILEPPIITVNTVLSLLALDYPANKLACYVSDDGCSPLTFYALVEASKFAKLWVPFCKKYNVQVRAPFRYFSDEAMANHDSDENGLVEFRQEWLRMKEEYEQLTRKIQDAGQKMIPCPLIGEFAVFSETKLRNHPAIIKVLWENKRRLLDGIPHLIYISREKRPEHPHHYKAGAMNVLTRVSGLMANAPFIMNIDCDMYVNNPKITLHAMCILLDPKGEKEVAFAQCPQQFYDGLKDDPFGNQMAAFLLYMAGGFAGLQGILYAGTNCFHRRKVMYGLSPTHDHIQSRKKENLGFANGTLSGKDIVQIFGTSREFVGSVTHALEGKTYANNDDLCKSLDLEAAKEVASCGYECSTAWGEKVGWMYGSTSEDVLTGLKIHARGWRSEGCGPNPMAYMGCSPRDVICHMAQQKRWSSGLVDICLSKHCPIFSTLFGKLQFRECLAYLWITTWALRSVPEICYAALPAYCIITNSSFLPKEPNLWIPITLLVIYKTTTLLESLKTGLSIRTWWNNQRMARITTTSAWFFGFVAILLKRLRISDTVFEITKKEHAYFDKVTDENAGRFIFNESPIFLPGTTILLVQLTALVMYWFGWQPTVRIGRGSGVCEVFCSAYLVACYWPFFKGLFRKGKYGIPLSTICKSVVLAFLFVHFCRSTIAD
ncbi:cellulose synthase-like protein H1 isoform X2 [Lotus japonicus]|uniref:cellulose synthase-like protein H1 isoform X2 n=1 Tax=Lotus japonicus TaxID=34305 RepID=UPI002589C29E|nr:cellulose synthase-like protein H1 isoform X2 [Lotus japonicus]